MRRSPLLGRLDTKSWPLRRTHSREVLRGARVEAGGAYAHGGP